MFFHLIFAIFVFIIFAPSQRGTFWMFAELIQDYNWILKILFRILLCCSRKLKKTKNFGAVRGQTYMSKRGCYGNDKWPKTKSWHMKTFKLWTPTDSLTNTNILKKVIPVSPYVLPFSFLALDSKFLFNRKHWTGHEFIF